MSLTRLGLHTAPADSSKGLTKALYNVLKVSTLRYLIVLFIEARTPFAFFYAIRDLNFEILV